MFQNITLGQYFPGNSLIHRLDPRTKFLTLIPIIIAVSLSRNVLILSGLLLFLTVIVTLSEVPVVQFLRQLRFFIWIVVFTMLIHPFVGGGEELLNLPLLGLSITSEGLYRGLFFGLRLLLLVSFSVLLMLTTSPSDLTDGIETLLRPLNRIGIQSGKFALMLGITLRFIPVLFEEGDRIRKAQTARGAQFEGSLRSRIHSLASIVIPLFISVINRSETLALALEIRGFSASRNRTYYNELKFQTADAGAFAVVLVIVSGVFLL